MNDENRFQYAYKHYEFVVSQWTEYFKVYIQSWSIMGSALIVGAIFFPSKLPDAKSSLVKTLLGITPLLILVWFLLTSWMWAYLAIYRSYAEHLEKNMKKDFSNEISFYPELHSKYGQKWLKSKGHHAVLLLTLVLFFLIYIILACQASKSLFSSSDRNCWILFVSYIACAVGTFLAAQAFIKDFP